LAVWPIHAIDSTKAVLSDLRVFNKGDWVVRYPQLHEQPQEPPSTTLQRPSSLRRSLSFADDPSSQTEVTAGSQRKGLTRSITLAAAAVAETAEEAGTNPINMPLR